MKKCISIFIISLLLLSGTLAGCSKGAENTIKIATKPMTEQFILSEMLKAIIEEKTQLKVEITKGIGGGTGNIQPALLKGDFDLYPEYTGTAWLYVLKNTEIPDDATLLNQLRQQYEKEYDLEWVGMYGFNNTYGIAVHRDFAEEHNLQSFSDLSSLSETMTFGAEYDFFEREDGYDALCAAYGYNFKKHVDLDIGLKYKALEEKQVDAIIVFTTDGQISSDSITVLKDDKNYYQTYYCGTVVRKDVLEKYPELRDALMKMDNILTDQEMAELNYKVEGEGLDEKDVAIEFLKSKGLIV